MYSFRLLTTGAGVDTIGTWFGTGTDRGIALLFTFTGFIGLIVTLMAMRSRSYKKLSAYQNKVMKTDAKIRALDKVN